MNRREFIQGSSAASAALFMSLPAVAKEKITSGEIWVTLKNSDYAKPYFEGREYEDHEFENNGFKLVIRIADYNEPISFEVRPSVGDFAPITITTVPKKFRVTRVRGSRERRWVYKTKAVFKKPAAPKK